MSGRRSLNVIVVPDGGRDSHTFNFSYRRLIVLGSVTGIVILAAAVMMGSWWYLAARAASVAVLRERIAELEEDQMRMVSLASHLTDLESRYEKVRVLFGTGAASSASELWLPPPVASRARQPDQVDPESAMPSSWPLTERGFVTQAVMAGAEGGHPGLDIAIPVGSYIRSVGSGVVTEAGEDEIYGQFVVVDHGNGYESRYAHASELLVSEGSRVRRNEVIGLTGSTGHSTAPHLHFEIILGGTPVDPLEMVRRP